MRIFFVLVAGLLSLGRALRIHEEGEPAGDELDIGDSGELCFDEMCVSRDTPDHMMNFDDVPKDDVIRKIQTDDPHSRTLLLSLCEPFHSSTALLGLLMSSQRVSTLCKAETWQCEGGPLMGRRTRPSKQSRGKPVFTKPSKDWDWGEALSIFGDVWDLSRPILVDKTPNLVKYVPENHPKIMAAAEKVAQEGKPYSFRYHQIHKLNAAYLLTWRPVCLHLLGRLSQDPEQYSHYMRIMEKELPEFEEMVQAHKYLRAQNATVVVVNLADLIWRPRMSAQRLAREMPLLGELNPEFSPVLHRDIYDKNSWKASGSVAAFGRKADPFRAKYTVATGVCEGGSEGFLRLSEEDRSRALAAVEYLRSFSKID